MAEVQELLQPSSPEQVHPSRDQHPSYFPRDKGDTKDYETGDILPKLGWIVGDLWTDPNVVNAARSMVPKLSAYFNDWFPKCYPEIRVIVGLVHLKHGGVNYVHLGEDFIKTTIFLVYCQIVSRSEVYLPSQQFLEVLNAPLRAARPGQESCVQKIGRTSLGLPTFDDTPATELFIAGLLFGRDSHELPNSDLWSATSVRNWLVLHWTKFCTSPFGERLDPNLRFPTPLLLKALTLLKRGDVKDGSRCVAEALKIMPQPLRQIQGNRILRGIDDSAEKNSLADSDEEAVRPWAKELAGASANADNEIPKRPMGHLRQTDSD